MENGPGCPAPWGPSFSFLHDDWLIPAQRTGLTAVSRTGSLRSIVFGGVGVIPVDANKVFFSRIATLRDNSVARRRVLKVIVSFFLIVTGTF